MGKLITLPFAALLRWMYSITGSYGVAIILFSLILKLRSEERRVGKEC